MSSYRRVTRVLSLVLGAMPILAACAPPIPGSDVEAAPGTSKIVVAPSSEMSAAWAQLAVGQELGYFEEEGITIEPQWPGGSSEVLQAMATDRVQIGAPTPEAVLAAAEKGQDVTMVYNWTRTPVQYLAIPAGSEYHSYADMGGTTIGVANLASGAKILAEAALRDAGVDPTTVTFIAVGTGVAAWDALRQNRVDALMLWDTEYAKMESAGATLRFVPPDAYEDLFSTTFAVRAEWMKRNPEIVEGFGRAWAKATVWATENPEAAVELVWKHYPKTKTSDDPALLEQHVRLFEQRNEVALAGDPGGNRAWGKYAETAVAHWTTFAAENGITTGALDPSGIYTNEFVDAYNQFDAESIVQAARSYK